MLRNSKYEMVPLEKINATPFFRLSFGNKSDRLKESINKIGLVSPLILQPDKQGRFDLVCGSRRLAVLRELDETHAPALLVGEGREGKDLLGLALDENLAHRKFNQAEKVFAVKYLRDFYSDDEVVSKFMPRLGLPPKTTMLERFVKLSALPPDALSTLAENLMDSETAEILLDFSQEDQTAILNFIHALKPGINKQSQIITWLFEICKRDDVSVQSILNHPEMTDVLFEPNLSRPDREKKARQNIYEIRFPEISRLKKLQASALNKLNFPKKLKLSPPQAFEGLDFTIKMEFSNFKDLNNHIDFLNKLSKSSQMAELMELG